MEPVGPMLLHVPPNPRWQRPVLVIVVERREVPPLRIASPDFCHARFEIDPKAFPHKQKPAHSRRRALLAPSWPESPRREKQRNESRFKQHSIRLIRGKILRRTYEGEETYKANRQHSPWPQIQNQQNRRDHAYPANCRQHVSPARKPQQCRGI